MRSTVALACTSLSLCLAAGCGHAAEEGGSIEVRIPPYEVPLGADMVRCSEMPLPSARDVDIVRFKSSSSEGMHHVHVFVAAGGRTGGPERSYDCPDSVSFDKWHLLIAVQAAGLDWSLPEGVAIHVAAGQSLLVQTHWLNTGTAGPHTTLAQGSVTFGLAAPGAALHQAAAVVGQNLDIDVPPHSTGRAFGECTLPGAGNVLAMMGHYHTHGRRFEVEARRAGEEPSVIYDSDSSPELPWRTFDGLHLGEGTRLGWSCDYANNLDTALQTGPHVGTEEHCILFSFFEQDGGDTAFVPCVVGGK